MTWWDRVVAACALACLNWQRRKVERANDDDFLAAMDRLVGRRR